MNRRVLLWAVLVLAVSVVAMAADAPSGTIRWDSYNSQSPSPVTRGPAPSVYNLSRPFNWPEDIEVDDDGCFYVLCHVRQSITKFRPDGSFDKLWLEDTGHPCVGSVMDMAVLPGERIYLASDHWLPIIRRFGPDTNLIENLDGVSGVSSIVADKEGDYYLHRGFDMRVFSSEGKPKATWKVEQANSMSFGPDGNIYMPVYNKPTLAVYSTTGALVRNIDLSGLPTSSNEWNIAVDTNGDIYMSCGLGIIRLDNSGRPIAFWHPYRGADDAYAAGSVVDVAARNGLIYGLLRRFNAPPEVQTFTPDGQCIARYLFPKLDVELPWSVAVHPDGRYAVHQAQTSSGQDSVLLFGPDDKQSGSIPDLDGGSVADVAAMPSGGYYVARYKRLERVDRDGGNCVLMREKDQYVELSVDETTGNVYVRTDKQQIEVISPGGVLLRTILLDQELALDAETPLHSAKYAMFMAFDKRGFLYFADTDHHRILKLDGDGTFLAEIGREGSGLGELRRPKGLTVDPEGRLIVADTRNNRIQVFSPTGEPLGVWGKLGQGDGELDRPHGVTLLPGKAVFIADTHNDRVVTVPWSRFWQEVSREIKAPPPYIADEKVPMPVVGEVTVEGIVVAGTNDFTDCVYIQAADRSWGTRVTMPANVPANRGDRIKVTGTLELKEHSARYLQASKSEYVLSAQNMPGPLGMANLYVGDGYRMGDKPSDLSNLGLLVKSWGRVLMADPLNKRFVISDGSRLGNAPGLEVYGGQLKSPITQWPKVGQYVMVTGISAVRPSGSGTFQPAIRLRAQEDLQVLVEN